MSMLFNCQKHFYFFEAIQFQFCISTQSWCQNFSSIWSIDRALIRCYHSGPEWTWERWQWRVTQHSPKLQQYLNLNIRLFSVISRTLVGGVLPHGRDTVGVFYSPSRLSKVPVLVDSANNKLLPWLLSKKVFMRKIVSVPSSAVFFFR